jgi:hypothetical protein
MTRVEDDLRIEAIAPSKTASYLHNVPGPFGRNQKNRSHKQHTPKRNADHMLG